MATRSRIAIEKEDGTVLSIYCHWDGYPSNNGMILQENYQDREKVEKLISLGDISSLAPEVDIPEGSDHSFSTQDSNITLAYHRDRGDDLNQPKVNETRKGFIRSDVEEYGYLFTKEGKWLFVNGHKNPHTREAIQLDEILENEG
jgi:hypothetical protein